MSKRSEEAASKSYPEETRFNRDYNQLAKRQIYQGGYEQAEEDIISLIESRLSELLGDAQPTPILRYELLDLIKKIKEEE